MIIPVFAKYYVLGMIYGTGELCVGLTQLLVSLVLKSVKYSTRSGEVSY